MQTLTLLHSDTFPIGKYTEALLRESIAPKAVGSSQLQPGDGNSLRVLLIDRDNTADATNVVDHRTAIVGVGLDEQPRWLSDDNVYLQLPENPSTTVLLSAVKRAYQFLYQKMRADQLERQLG